MLNYAKEGCLGVNIDESKMMVLEEKEDRCIKSVWMEGNWTTFQSLSNWNVLDESGKVGMLQKIHVE